MEKSYHTRLAAAWVRGKLAERFPNDPIFQKSLQDITPTEQQQLVRLGRQEGLEPYFLRVQQPTAGIEQLFNVLRAVQADHILDLSAKEVEPAFVWLLIRAFPYLPVMEIEIKNRWLKQIKALHNGGIRQLDSQAVDPERMSNFMSGQFDVVTSTYALNELTNPDLVFRELLRLSKRYVLLVLREEGSNAIRFTKERIRKMGEDQQLLQLKVDQLDNEWVVVARK